jgi:Flp pilus assembly pilin Flp
MSDMIGRFLRNEDGQDVIEYSLLISFVALSVVWLLAWTRDPVKGIWTSVNSTIVVANTAAGGSN